MGDERKCKNTRCGKPITWGRSSRQFCSSACKKADYNARHRAEINEKQRYRNKTPEARAASKKYRAQRRSVDRDIRERISREGYAWGLHGIPVNCETCGEVFEAFHPNHKFCKKECRMKGPLARAKKSRGDKRYRSKPDRVIAEHERAARRYADIKSDAEAYAEWRCRIDAYRTPEVQRAKNRRRSAMVALSTIFLPIENPFKE